MVCSDVEKKLNAWVDDELPVDEKQCVDDHLAQCSDCRKKAEEMERIADLLNALPPVYAPKSLTKAVLKVFRADFKKTNTTDIWRSLTPFMRSALCGAALVGFLCGVFLGSTLVDTSEDMVNYPYQTFYISESILP